MRRQREDNEERIVRPRTLVPLIIRLDVPSRGRTLNFNASFAQIPGNEFSMENILQSVSQGLIQTIRRTVRNENINVNESRIAGYLFISNISGQGATFRSDRVLLNDLTPDFILDQFSRIVSPQSNPDLSVTDVEYEFWIDPFSLIVGAKKLDGSLEWKPHPDFKDKLNCCAIAIAIGIIRKDPDYKSMNHNINRKCVSEFVYEIQEKYFPGEYSSYTDIQMFVESEKKYKVIIHSCFIRNPVIYGNGDIVIQIYFDLGEKHYYLMTGPIRFIDGIYGRVKQCKECFCISRDDKDWSCNCGKVLIFYLVGN